MKTENDKQLEEPFFSYEWLNHGYTFKNSVKAKTAYEKWAGERLTFKDVEHAITGKGERGGLFAERVSAFFAGYLASINDTKK